MPNNRIVNRAVLTFVATMFWISSAWAQDDDYDCGGPHTLAIMQKIYPQSIARTPGLPFPENIHVDLARHRDETSVKCRVWPGHPDLTLLAFPLIDSDDIRLMVIKSSNLDIEGQLLLKNATAAEQPLQIKFVDFDTANYHVTSSLVAFGLRTTREDISPASPLIKQQLSLFSLQNGKIVPLLEDMITKLEVADLGHISCHDQKFDKEIALHMSLSSHHGYRDIFVLENQIASTGGSIISHCAPTTVSLTVRHVLSFDGTRYRLPSLLKAQ
ncbi:hypothetical protein [Ochrobactrum quorumnocens]|uniref:hypothetical protein n=1 Tax=Ochrobactrum quorumnocens TaxID=271865 RepID=UPI003BA00210